MYNDFEIYKSNILDEVIFINPDVFKDSRGSLYTTFLKDKFENLLPQNISFVHDKFAVSKKNVLRGIHGDFFSWKLISCVYGQIFQVVVDNRKE
jgi:dTDP-4-dehydrorhamnose 3,5-epimerase